MSGPGSARSLRSLHPGKWWIPALLLVAGALLLAGQVLPGVSLRAVGRPEVHYSVYGGVVDLWKRGNEWLAVVLFSFSIVFPTVKWLALVWIWFRPLDAARRASAAHWLKPLGKWSLLDTFVVAALVGAVQLRSTLVDLATAEVESAVYAFAASIVITIFLSFRIARLADDAGGAAHYVPRPDGTLIVAPLAAAGCLAAGLVQPLLLVEKKVFNHTYAFPTAWRALVADGEWFLAALLALFAVLLPLVFFLGLGLSAWRQSHRADGARALSALVAVERWSMVDVYFLGVLLVNSKVDGFADATRLPGFWFLAAAAALSVYCAIRLRRVY